MTDAELRAWLGDALWHPVESWYFPVIDRAAGRAMYLARPELVAAGGEEMTREMTATWERVAEEAPDAIVIEPLAPAARIVAILGFIETLPAEEAKRQIGALRRNARKLDDWRPSAPRWLLELDDEAAARLDAFLADDARAAIDELILLHDLDPAKLRRYHP